MNYKKLNRKDVELLAPAGNYAALETVVAAGADAVYLGGKHFNMRLHRSDMNLSDEELKKAVEHTHANGVKLYITINNLISTAEIPALKEYLSFLNDEVKPDAILVQDLAVLAFLKEMNSTIPVHASIMMNTHNKEMVKFLQRYGVSRVVASREMSLNELALLRERTGIEVEYFVHGDMCIAESGQCIHSGVLFGQSGNRGRCLKPCRWPYSLVDENGKIVEEDKYAPYKLALKDMCMYRRLPELIRAGVVSFKIEGRMRTPEFLGPLVNTYRQAIDEYLNDPSGYATDEVAYGNLLARRARDFTTTFAVSPVSPKDIGYTGEREPRFFSKAIPEADMNDEAFRDEAPIAVKESNSLPKLNVRVASPSTAKAAIEAGADGVYIGGDIYRPNVPWKLKEIRDIAAFAHENGKKVYLRTPRTTMDRELAEFAEMLPEYQAAGVDGYTVGNVGSLNLIKDYYSGYNGVSLPEIHGEVYLNLFNSAAAKMLEENGVAVAAASQEMSYSQLKELAENSPIPIAAIVHGSVESMICDHDFLAMLAGKNENDGADYLDKHYSLKDEVGELHRLRVDQFRRTHILFSRDICLYGVLDKLMGLGVWRIEAQDYDDEQIRATVSLYRKALDDINSYNGTMPDDFAAKFSQKLGIGAFRFKRSIDSI